jgi:diguanylate cyclase (GGDEF)-like protein/PAS domain S-box-containing protein
MSKTTAVDGSPLSSILDFDHCAGNHRDIQAVIERDGTVVAASTSVADLLGYQGSVVGRNIAEFLHPDEFLRAFELIENTEAPEMGTDIRLRHHLGHYILFEAVGKVFPGDGNRIVITAREVTNRREAEAVHRIGSDRFEGIAQSAPIAIMSFDRDRKCEFVNRRWTELSGQPISEALGTGWMQMIRRRDAQRLARLTKNQQIGYLETVVYCANGARRSVILRWTAQLDAAGNPAAWVTTFEDVTERKALEARLLHQARHDALTGLPNRTVLTDRLQASLDGARAVGLLTVVAFGDLDRFKFVNDSLGHQAGDRLLYAVAQRLADEFRGVDVIARFGGDEFVVVATVKERSAADRLSARFAAAFEQPFELGLQRPYACTVSVGVSVSTPDATADSMLRDADVAMYRAKEQGRGTVASFDERMRSKAQDRLAIEADLAGAIHGREFCVVYQPIVDAENGQVTAVEALVRWDHPTRGRLSPESFIEIAEETGMIVAIGDWVLEQSCRDLLHAGDVALNVNLSPRQLGEPGLAKRIAAILDRTGFPAQRLTVEITESVLVSDLDLTISTLSRLKGVGIGIAVDDFGTGYSSLNYLSKLPLDILKIDRSFVAGLDQPAGDVEIVRAVVALAHALGLSATAEGVETEAQLETLRTFGCDRIQGYLFGRPVAITDLTLPVSAGR